MPRTLFQFSLRVTLAVITLVAVYLALLRTSDAISALTFLIFVAWLISPLLLSFAVLYYQIHGSRSRQRRRPRE